MDLDRKWIEKMVYGSMLKANDFDKRWYEKHDETIQRDENGQVCNCLYDEKVSMLEGVVIGHGVMMDVTFDAVSLKLIREEVREILKEFPSDCKNEGNAGDGGGCSMLSLPYDQQSMNLLFTLGTALGYVGYCFRREVWKNLPGSMPYVWVDTRDVPVLSC